MNEWRLTHAREDSCCNIAIAQVTPARSLWLVLPVGFVPGTFRIREDRRIPGDELRQDSASQMCGVIDFIFEVHVARGRL